MISNQILQNTIEGLKTISRADLCIMDIEGKVLVSTFAEQVASSAEVLSFVESQADSQVIKGFQYFKVYDEHQLEYVLIAGGGSEDIYMICLSTSITVPKSYISK